MNRSSPGTRAAGGDDFTLPGEAERPNNLTAHLVEKRELPQLRSETASFRGDVKGGQAKLEL